MSTLEKWARDLKVYYGLESSPIYQFGKILEFPSITVSIGKVKVEDIYYEVPVYGVINYKAEPHLRLRGFKVRVVKDGTVTVKSWMRARFVASRIKKNRLNMDYRHKSPFGFYSCSNPVNIYIYPTGAVDAILIWTSDWRANYFNVFMKKEGSSEEYVTRVYLDGFYECYHWCGALIDLITQKGVCTRLDDETTKKIKGASASWNDGTTTFGYKTKEQSEQALWSNLDLDEDSQYEVNFLKDKVKLNLEYIRIEIPDGIQIPGVALYDRSYRVIPITGVVGYKDVKRTFKPGGAAFRKLKTSLDYQLPFVKKIDITYGVDQSGQANIDYSILGLGESVGDEAYLDVLKKRDYLPEINSYVEIELEYKGIEISLFKGLVDSVEVQGDGSVTLRCRDFTKLLMSTICHRISLSGYKEPLVYKNTHYSVIVRDMFHIAGLSPFFIGQLDKEAKCETIDLQGKTPFDGIRDCSNETGFVYWSDPFCFYWGAINIDAPYNKYYVSKIKEQPKFVENDVYRTHLEVVGKKERTIVQFTFPEFRKILPRPLFFANPQLTTRQQLANVIKVVRNIIALELTDTTVEIPGGNPFISPLNILVCFDELETLVMNVSHSYDASTGELSTSCEGISLSKDYKAIIRPDPNKLANLKFYPSDMYSGT